QRVKADGNKQILRFNTVSPSQLRPPGTDSCQKVNAIGRQSTSALARSSLSRDNRGRPFPRTHPC
ncbi:MAG: hypothetical protein ACKOEO_05345, partial [Planctomycetaceae bacterium]